MSKIFPKWSNRLPLLIVIFVFLLAGTVTAGITYYFTPKYTRVGYQPDQPVPFDHSLHAGQLGLDCRYCHTYVEQVGPFQYPDDRDLHELSQSDSDDQRAARSGPGESGQWRCHSVGAHPQGTGLRLFRPLGPCEPGHQLCLLSRQDQRDGEWCATTSPRACPGVWIAIGPPRITSGHWIRSTISTGRPNRRKCRSPKGSRLVENWNVKPPQSCSGCHR